MLVSSNERVCLRPSIVGRPPRRSCYHNRAANPPGPIVEPLPVQRQVLRQINAWAGLAGHCQCPAIVLYGHRHLGNGFPMTARIYKPAKTAMQSGQAKTKDWVIDFEPEEPRQI